MANNRKSQRTRGDEVRISDNRPAVLGLVLSVIQLLMHTTWLGLITWLSASGRAEQLDASSFLAWLVVVLMGLSTVMTFAAIYVCLFHGLRHPPRTLALVGLALSFFFGVFAFAVVILSFLRFAGA